MIEAITTFVMAGVLLSIAEIPVLVGLVCIAGFAALCVAMGIS